MAEQWTPEPEAGRLLPAGAPVEWTDTVGRCGYRAPVAPWEMEVDGIVSDRHGVHARPMVDVVDAEAGAAWRWRPEPLSGDELDAWVRTGLEWWWLE